jgi:hypothetical protein
MDNLGKEFYQMIEGLLGPVFAKSVLFVCVLAVVGTAGQVIFNTIVSPLSYGVTEIFKAFKPAATQQELVRSVVQLGISLIGTGVGVVVSILLMRRLERASGANLNKSEELLRDVSSVLERLKNFHSRIQEEKTKDGKIALLDQLMGPFSLGDGGPTGTRRNPQARD